MLAACAQIKDDDAAKENTVSDNAMPIVFDGEMIPLNSIPDSYTIEEAALDGCVVEENFEIIANEEVYNEFIKRSLEGKTAKMRVVSSISMLFDPSAEVTDELRVRDWAFDGQKYIQCYYVKNEELQFEYEGFESYCFLSDDEKNDEKTGIGALCSFYGHDPETAQRDGCIVISGKDGKVWYDSALVFESDKWTEFYEKTQAGDPAVVRIAVYYTDELENCAKMNVFELDYNGNFYTVTEFSHLISDEATMNTFSFKYLLKCENTLSENNGFIYMLAQTDKYDAHFAYNTLTENNGFSFRTVFVEE